jgi:hypothetical protein
MSYSTLNTEIAMEQAEATLARRRNQWGASQTAAASHVGHSIEPIPALGFLFVIGVSAVFWGGVGLILWAVW